MVLMKVTHEFFTLRDLYFIPADYDIWNSFVRTVRIRASCIIPRLIRSVFFDLYAFCY